MINNKICFFIIILGLMVGCATERKPFSEFDPNSANYRQPVKVSNLGVINVTASTARIYFDTNEKSKARIQLTSTRKGQDKNFIEKVEGAFALNHDVSFSQLDPDTYYTLKLVNFDQFGRIIVASSTYAFQTARPLVLRIAGSKDLTTKLASTTGTFYADGLNTIAPFNALDTLRNLSTFREPKGLALDSNTGFIYVADSGNHSIRVMTPQGITSTVVGGTPNIGLLPLEANRRSEVITKVGTQQVVTILSPLKNPFGVTVASDSTVIVADTGHHRIVYLDDNNTAVTVAGNGTAGYVDGIGSASQFYYPQALVFNPRDNNIYVCDTYNYVIRRINWFTWKVTTFAGTGVQGTMDGVASAAQFILPTDIDVDGQGNIYVVDVSRVRKITLNGVVSTVLGNEKFKDSNSVITSPLDSKGILAGFGRLIGIDVSAEGSIYLTDPDNKQIRRFDPYSGITHTLLGGSSSTLTLASGTTSASAPIILNKNSGASTPIIGSSSLNLSNPYDLVLDRNGNLVITDNKSSEIFSMNLN